MKCTKCGSTNLVLVTSGPHEKLICGACLTFQKFLSKEDAKTFRQIQGEQEFDRDFGEHVCPDPTQLSDLEYLKAEILRKVVEAGEYLKNKEVDGRAQFFFLVTTLKQIQDLCK